MEKLITLAVMILVSGKSFAQLPKKTKVLRLNEIELYYEVYG